MWASIEHMQHVLLHPCAWGCCKVHKVVMQTTARLQMYSCVAQIVCILVQHGHAFISSTTAGIKYEITRVRTWLLYQEVKYKYECRFTYIKYIYIILYITLRFVYLPIVLLTELQQPLMLLYEYYNT